MEKSTPIGLISGLLLVYGAIFMGDGWATFFDPASLLLVVGGTVAALLISFSMDEMKLVPQTMKDFFGYQAPDLRGYVTELTELARLSRREGLLALDRRLADTKDEFLAFGLEMAVDGIDADEITSLMRSRMKMESQQRLFGNKFFNAAGTYAPAFGMVGTLIGLIQMLQNLSDPSAIGGSMAVAMITTFYGALLANLIFLPFAAKMKTQAMDIAKARELVMTGVLGIVRGESPSMIEKRLMLFLADSDAKPADDAPELAKAA